jgi:hypothetical protein
MFSEPCTKSGAMQFGNTSRKMMCPFVSPRATEASTYASLRSESVADRPMRAMYGV